MLASPGPRVNFRGLAGVPGNSYFFLNLILKIRQNFFRRAWVLPGPILEVWPPYLSFLLKPSRENMAKPILVSLGSFWLGKLERFPKFKENFSKFPRPLL